MLGFRKNLIPYYEANCTLVKQLPNGRNTDSNGGLFRLSRNNKKNRHRKLSGQGDQFTMSMGNKFPYLPKIGFDKTWEK